MADRGRGLRRGRPHRGGDRRGSDVYEELGPTVVRHVDVEIGGSRPAPRSMTSAPMSCRTATGLCWQDYSRGADRGVHMNWTLEVVVVPVADVDRAKAFYRSEEHT